MDRPRPTEMVRPRVCRSLPVALLAGLVLTMPTPALAARTKPATVEDLARLSLEEPGTVEVTSVSRRPEPLAQAPAAVCVISDDDIRRSGARSLPEILRLAPNLHVARLNAVDYAISARGFNSTQAANKLLVLLDGREVYTALLGGVFGACAPACAPWRRTSVLAVFGLPETALAAPLLRGAASRAKPPAAPAVDAAGLHGRRGLVVEDVLATADTIAAHLRELGCEVVGPVPRLPAAVLDVNLDGEMAWPAADVLRTRGVPILLLTGYDAPTLPAERRDAPRLGKPADEPELTAALIRLLADRPQPVPPA